jgi:hypothetical protein
MVLSSATILAAHLGSEAAFAQDVVREDERAIMEYLRASGSDAHVAEAALVLVESGPVSDEFARELIRIVESLNDQFHSVQGLDIAGQEDRLTFVRALAALDRDDSTVAMVRALGTGYPAVEFLSRRPEAVGLIVAHLSGGDRVSDSDLNDGLMALQWMARDQGRRLGPEDAESLAGLLVSEFESRRSAITLEAVVKTAAAFDGQEFTSVLRDMAASEGALLDRGVRGDRAARVTSAAAEALDARVRGGEG